MDDLHWSGMKNLIIFIIFCTFFMFSCGNKSSLNEKERFITIERQNNFKIVYDSESKVEYSVSQFGQITMLIDSFGNPKTHH